MLVGWIFVLIRNRELTKAVVLNTWMMAGGILSLVVIITVLVLFTVFLGREVREVRRQDSFIDSVTHELRSPLAAIRLCLETSQRQDLPREKKVELERMMLEDVSRLDTLIDAVLLASRVGEGKGLSQVERVSLGPLLRRSAERVTQRHHVDAEAVSLELAREFVVRGDPSVLALVADNILDNAVKYSADPPEIRVRVSETPSWVHLDVVDNGIGISRQDLKRIFERFYRVPEASVRARHGTGLGLFIVAAMVRNMGGKIRATSEGRGKGTTMRVSLPARMVAAKEADHPEVG